MHVQNHMYVDKSRHKYVCDISPYSNPVFMFIYSLFFFVNQLLFGIELIWAFFFIILYKIFYCKCSIYTFVSNRQSWPFMYIIAFWMICWVQKTSPPPPPRKIDSSINYTQFIFPLRIRNRTTLINSCFLMFSFFEV